MHAFYSLRLLLSLHSAYYPRIISIIIARGSKLLVLLNEVNTRDVMNHGSWRERSEHMNHIITYNTDRVTK